MTDTRIGLVIVLLAVGCNAAKQSCEHARDVMAAEWERNAKDAIAGVDPGKRRELQRVAAKEVEHLRKTFVDTCVAQPEATHRCVAKIDELLAVERERKASKATAATAEGECEAPMDALMAAVTKGL